MNYRIRQVRSLKRGQWVLKSGTTGEPRLVERVTIGYGDPEQVAVSLRGENVLKLWDASRRVLCHPALKFGDNSIPTPDSQ